MRATFLLTTVGAFLFLAVCLCAQDPAHNPAEFEKKARQLRETAIHNLEPQAAVPRAPRDGGVSEKYPWKHGIVSTLFWIGSAEKGEDDHQASAWDPQWQVHYGGIDDPNPEKRHEYIPADFTPRQNPFYIALPYNDVTNDGVTKPEAKVIIPWFKEAFVQEGQSVCRDRWVAIRNSADKVCYAQWSDCGPFQTDHWQYVFGNEKPRPNANSGTGLNVSPAVREYLQLGGTDVVDWKFVEMKDVPRGPWRLYGTNNPFTRRGTVHPAPGRTPADGSSNPNAAAGEAVKDPEPKSPEAKQ